MPLSDPLISRVRDALLPLRIEDGADEVKREGQRQASVLMPLIKRREWVVLLTQRPMTMHALLGGKHGSDCVLAYACAGIHAAHVQDS